MLARSRYNFDRSREFIPGYKFGGGHWRSVAVQTISKAVIYHGAGFQLRADARFAQRSGAKLGVRVHKALQICLECRSKSKKFDDLSRNSGKQLTHIVRVSCCFYLDKTSKNQVCFLLSFWLCHCHLKSQIRVIHLGNLSK